jgi:hypothetical protein
MNDQRNWVNIEVAADKLNCEVEVVQKLIRAGKLQTKRDSFGSTLISVCSIQAAAGGVQLRGVT